MLELNWFLILGTGILPILVGFVYYGKMAFNDLWMRAARLNENDLQQGSMAKALGTALFMGILLAVFLMPIVIHDNHVFSLVAIDGPPATDTELYRDAKAFSDKYGSHFRTFKHGLLHGVLAAVFGAWPLLSIVSVFERRGWKYVAVHVGYWVITLGLMGGIICAWA